MRNTALSSEFDRKVLKKIRSVDDELYSRTSLFVSAEIAIFFNFYVLVNRSYVTTLEKYENGILLETYIA